MSKRYVLKFLCLLVCAALCSASLVSCGSTNSVKQKFIGVWDINEIVSGTKSIEFGKTIGSFLLMEMSVQFNDDDTYVIHYYVNGKEGDKYPQTGTYRIEGEKLIMSDGGIATVDGGSIVIDINGSYQYGTLRNP